MKFVHLFLFAIALCAFNACEKQPYSKIESMTEEHKSEAKAEEHPAKEGEKPAAPEKAEHAKQ